MGTQIYPMLAVSDGAAAIEFYKAAFVRPSCGVWEAEGTSSPVSRLTAPGSFLRRNRRLTARALQIRSALLPSGSNFC
jgi:hypothetical protein